MSGDLARQQAWPQWARPPRSPLREHRSVGVDGNGKPLLRLALRHAPPVPFRRCSGAVCSRAQGGRPKRDADAPRSGARSRHGRQDSQP
eukprot:7246782-Prymnesium_polylepis.1